LQKINCRIIANLPNGFLDEKEFSIIKNLYGTKNSLLKLLDMGFLGKVEPDVVADIILLVVKLMGI
jgi:hypothetical protein